MNRGQRTEVKVGGQRAENKSQRSDVSCPKISLSDPYSLSSDFCLLTSVL